MIKVSVLASSPRRSTGCSQLAWSWGIACLLPFFSYQNQLSLFECNEIFIIYILQILSDLLLKWLSSFPYSTLSFISISVWTFKNKKNGQSWLWTPHATISVPSQLHYSDRIESSSFSNPLAIFFTPDVPEVQCLYLMPTNLPSTLLLFLARLSQITGLACSVDNYHRKMLCAYRTCIPWRSG